MKIFTRFFQLSILFGTLFASAQTPVIVWDEAMGGGLTDNLRSIYPTDDGGAILAGRSLSDSSADKSEDAISPGLWDYWIVKIDDNGDIEWENTIGGEGEDFPHSVVTTDDGGYIVAGISTSGIGADKSEANLGSRDLWIVKLNSSGAIDWDETIGGVSLERVQQIIALADGSFVIAASSQSPMSADKSENSYGFDDVWILKIDSTGNIVWENTIGGSGSDVATAICELPDGNFVVAAESQSPISGEKTAANLGGTDYWLIGLDANGNKLWDRTYGGSDDEIPGSIYPTLDGNIVVGGESGSDSSPTKSEDAIGPVDYWILKLSPTGDIIWDNTIGGNSGDLQGNVNPLANGEYLVCGWSFSGVSGDKTVANSGDTSSDFWILRLSADGTINWQDTVGGDGGESVFEAEFAPGNDGTVIIGGSSLSGISGDRTEPNLGANDYWVVKFDNVLGLSDNRFNSDINLAQNPVGEELQVLGIASAADYKIYNLNGQLVSSGSLSTDGATNVSGLRSGAYLIAVSEGEKTISLKFVKR